MMAERGGMFPCRCPYAPPFRLHAGDYRGMSRQPGQKLDRLAIRFEKEVLK